MKHREWRCACLMLKVYIREGLLYKKSELLKALDFSENNERDKASYNKLINELKRKRLLKTRRKKGSRESLDDDASLISEDDVDFDDYVGDEGDCIQYLFRFVGVIFHDDRIINVYPKYVESGNRLEDHMRQVINVIRKHQGKLYRLDVSAILEEIDRGEEITELSIILFLINDYSRNGLYFETEKITEYNGYGDIQWGKTVENITPIMTNNRPIYMDVLTCKRKDNDFNYFVRLHKYILTEASNELEKTDLTEFFSLPQIELSNDEYSDFGDTEYILNVIDAEMGRQFDDRKLAVLHAMYLYIRQKKAATIHYMKSSDEGLRFFGTRAFHKVWEDVIDSVYVSQKDLSFGEIKTKYVNTLDYTFNLPNGSSCLVQANQNLGSMILKKEDNQPYPWVCNWHDLENIIEILQYLNKKPDDFIDYIVWRIANHPNVLSSDELDVIEGYFINSYVKKEKGAIYFPPNGPSLIDKIYFEKHGIPYEFPREKSPVHKKKKIGRNDPCPCNSGKKFKKCCIGKGIYD